MNKKIFTLTQPGGGVVVYLVFEMPDEPMTGFTTATAIPITSDAKRQQIVLAKSPHAADKMAEQLSSFHPDHSGQWRAFSVDEEWKKQVNDWKRRFGDT